MEAGQVFLGGVVFLCNHLQITPGKKYNLLNVLARIYTPRSLLSPKLSLPGVGRLTNRPAPRLEHFPNLLNRAGFPKRGRSDSSCVLAEEAGMHGEGVVG
jgi:hypothetical protein